MDEQHFLLHSQKDTSYFDWMYTLENKNLTGSFFSIKDIRDIIYILFYDKINTEFIQFKERDPV